MNDPSNTKKCRYFEALSSYITPGFKLRHFHGITFGYEHEFSTATPTVLFGTELALYMVYRSQLQELQEHEADYTNTYLSHYGLL